MKNIPHGDYCYTIISENPFKTKACPHWNMRTDKPNQENGYCSFLKKGDWDSGFSLLWDQGKECDVNK